MFKSITTIVLFHHQNPYHQNHHHHNFIVPPPPPKIYCFRHQHSQHHHQNVVVLPVPVPLLNYYSVVFFTPTTTTATTFRFASPPLYVKVVVALVRRWWAKKCRTRRNFSVFRVQSRWSRCFWLSIRWFLLGFLDFEGKYYHLARRLGKGNNWRLFFWYGSQDVQKHSGTCKFRDIFRT